jgi:hypothetical protein
VARRQLPTPASQQQQTPIEVIIVIGTTLMTVVHRLLQTPALPPRRRQIEITDAIEMTVVRHQLQILDLLPQRKRTEIEDVMMVEGETIVVHLLLQIPGLRQPPLWQKKTMGIDLVTEKVALDAMMDPVVPLCRRTLDLLLLLLLIETT